MKYISFIRVFLFYNHLQNKESHKMQISTIQIKINKLILDIQLHNELRLGVSTITVKKISRTTLSE